MGRHLVDLDAFDSHKTIDILNTASDILKNPEEYSERMRGKILATLFYEPSTRTCMSFQSAMMRLGGQVLGFSDPQNSSVSKGESLKDTVKVVANYADAIVIRHPREGTAAAAAIYSSVPVINAGDGAHLHPTQTLTDLFTLMQTKGRLSGLNIGLCGDLKYGRTVHSLIKAVSKFGGNKFTLISTEELSLPGYIKDVINEYGCSFTEVNSLADAVAGLDVLYMTRIQKERFDSAEEYARQKGVFVLDVAKLKPAGQDMIIMHPLPRIDEIAHEIDDDERAVYFDQTKYGLYARMALILHLLEDKTDTPQKFTSNSDKPCCNDKCITKFEDYLPLIYNDGKCAYCEWRVKI